MPRKLVPAQTKLAAVLRILKGESTSGNEARRIGVTVKAVNCWRREYLKAHPQARDLSEMPKPPPGIATTPEPPPAAGAAPVTSSAVEDSGGGAPRPPGGELDQAAVDAAVEADGDISLSQRPAPGSPPPPSPTAISISTEAEDMAIVEGAGNQLMGLASRVMIFVFERKAGVTVQVTPRIQELFVLTPTEKAMLKPASRHLAIKLRELIGSDDRVAYTVGGSTIAQGLWDRARVIGEAVAAAVREKRANEELEPATP